MDNGMSSPRTPPALPNGQPFATAVTKHYPGEPSSALAGEFRVDVDTGRRGQPPADDPTPA